MASFPSDVPRWHRVNEPADERLVVALQCPRADLVNESRRA